MKCQVCACTCTVVLRSWYGVTWPNGIYVDLTCTKGPDETACKLPYNSVEYARYYVNLCFDFALKRVLHSLARVCNASLEHVPRLKGANNCFYTSSERADGVFKKVHYCPPSLRSTLLFPLPLYRINCFHFCCQTLTATINETHDTCSLTNLNCRSSTVARQWQLWLWQ